MEPSPSHPHLDSLIAAVDQILSPGGCVWNRAQTHRTLAKYLIEEAAEAADAMETGDTDNLREELGDVLYQVILHAGIAQRTGEFDLEDIAATVDEKMRRRHPHVFGDAHAETIAEVQTLWDAEKAAEKSERTSVLDGIPAGLPALLRASKVVGRAVDMGLIDGKAQGPLGLTDGGQVGQLLLAVVAEARVAGFDPETELRNTVLQLEQEIRDDEAGAAAGQPAQSDAAAETPSGPTRGGSGRSAGRSR